MITFFRILIVEDEPLLRTLVAMAFEEEGYDVDTAADGAEALAKVNLQPPHAIVLDLMMPVMNGRDFLAAWQALPGNEAVPIVVITADYSERQRPSLDVQAILPKPFDIDLLVATVTSLVNSKE